MTRLPTASTARRLSRLAALLGPLLLAGCMVVPATRETYDAECRVMKREMVLESRQAAALSGCSGDACAGVLAAAGLFTAASAIVSGSIALVGNAVYWLEARGDCARMRTVPMPVAPGSAPAPAAGVAPAADPPPRAAH